MTAVLVPSGQALAVDQAMEPNSVLAAESFLGAQMTTPEDGRLRGYGFAATITSAGTADAATRLLSTFRPAAGQRLVAFALRFDLLREGNDTSHPVRATLVVDGRRSGLDEGDFVRSGERMYAASVPSAAEQAELEMSAAGLVQAFSLIEGHRVGDQPVVLYRDATGPDVVSDMNDERTLSASSAGDGAKGAVAVALKGVRLSYFSPGEPVTTAGSPNRAFLIVEGAGDGVQPPYGSPDYGRYFSSFAALPADAVNARLADGTVIEARHAGTDEGLLGGWYYFSVPADLTGASITVKPGTVDGSQYRGFVGQPARITIDGAASFDVPFGASAAPSPSPVTAVPAAPAERQPEKPIGQEGESWPSAALLAGVTAAVLVAALVGVRQKRRSGGVPRVQGPTRHSANGEHPPLPARTHAAEPERLLDVAGAQVALDGPGAEGATRAAIVEALTGESRPPAVVVMATGRAATLLRHVPSHPVLRLVDTADDVVRELDVAQLRRQRWVMEAAEGEASAGPWADVLVVVPAPLDRKIRLRLDEFDNPSTGPLAASVICLGRDAFPLAMVDSDGSVSTSAEGALSRRVSVMTETEAAAIVSRLASPAPSASAVVEEPAGKGTSPLISVRLLGPYRITAQTAELTTGLRAKARELLAFLTISREGATMDAAMEALWPGVDPEKGQSYFRTVLANLRTTLRAGAGLGDAVAVIERIGSRYRLDADLVAVDLWQFTDRIAELERADVADTRQKAADCYSGDFAAGEDFAWADPVREQLRRKAIDNLTALAESRGAAGDFHGALQSMERAIELDPYGEELYRAAMNMQLMLGRRDAAGRTLRLLEQRLGELDLRPQEATRRLLSGDVS